MPRNVMLELAKTHRAIAIDLPGYGLSDKPLDVKYDFAFYENVRIIYGENDRALPDVAKTMRRVKQAHPLAEVTSLPNCGHFLQEDEPERFGQLMAEF